MLAIIATGSKQYLVTVGQQIEVELLAAKELVEFKPLLIVDGDTTHIGKPTLDNATVSAKVITDVKKMNKIMVLKYKPKKRVHKTTGHRQRKTVVEITDIKA